MRCHPATAAEKEEINRYFPQSVAIVTRNLACHILGTTVARKKQRVQSVGREGERSEGSPDTIMLLLLPHREQGIHSAWKALLFKRSTTKQGRTNVSSPWVISQWVSLPVGNKFLRTKWWMSSACREKASTYKQVTKAEDKPQLLDDNSHGKRIVEF